MRGWVNRRIVEERKEKAAEKKEAVEEGEKCEENKEEGK
jgi:hypothetical protein